MKPTDKEIITLAEDESEDLVEIENEKEVEGKYVTYTNIYLHSPSDTYWAVYETRTNSGYWSDDDRVGDLEAEEVR